MEYLSVIEYFFDEAPGGSGRVAWDVAKMMRDKGHSVTILFYQKPGQKEGIEEYEGVRLIRFKKENKPKWHFGRMETIINSAANACHKYLNDKQWDVVHVHTALIGLGVVSALGDGPKYIMTVHSPIVMENEIIWKEQGLTGKLKLMFGRKLLKNAEKKLLNAATSIHTLSEYTKKIIDESYGVGDNVTIIPHWYESQSIKFDKATARSKLGWPNNAKILFTVRGMNPRYGLDIAIRALAAIVNNKEKNCHFYIGGRGPLRQQLERLASTLGASEKIHFIGRLSDEELELAYCATDVFILPTLSLECYGLITVEALSFGCPVIASDAGAIPEIMHPILPECIVPAGNVQALQNKVDEFLAGRLSLPDKQSLIDYTRTYYSKEPVSSRLMDLFEQ